MVLALVFGVGRVLGSTAQEPESGSLVARGDGSVSLAPAGQSTSGADVSASGDSGATGSAGPMDSTASTAGGPRPSRPPLAVPTGPCEDSDVRVRPSVLSPAYAAHRVTIRLHLSTISSPACTWEVSSRSVVVKLTSGDDPIWTTQHCPRAVPEQAVVLRAVKSTPVDVSWSGQRSDPECSKATDWARPGYYHATAAAFGADAEDDQFLMVKKPRATITPKPRPQRSQEPSTAGASDAAAGTETGEPTASPAAAASAAESPGG
jgi:hypothetical protein